MHVVSGHEADIQAEIARINGELAELRHGLNALKHEHEEKAKQDRLKQRMAELEAELRLYDLEREVAADLARKNRRRGFFKRR